MKTWDISKEKQYAIVEYVRNTYYNGRKIELKYVDDEWETIYVFVHRVYRLSLFGGKFTAFKRYTFKRDEVEQIIRASKIKHIQNKKSFIQSIIKQIKYLFTYMIYFPAIIGIVYWKIKQWINKKKNNGKY